MFLKLTGDAHLLSQEYGPLAHLTGQFQGAGNPVRMQDIIKYAEVVEKFEILKNEADISDTEIPPAGIVQVTDCGFPTLIEPAIGVRIPASR